MDAISNLFQVGGLATGLDSKSLIDQLMAIESRPIQVMQQRRSRLQSQTDAFRDINSRLATLQDRAAELLNSTFLKARTVTSSAPTIATATADTTALFASYLLNVTQLATATTATSAAGGTNGAIGKAITQTSTPMDQLNFATPVTAGTFSLMVNGVQKQITISSTDTLSTVFNAIKTATNNDVTASLSGNRIVLSAQNSVTTLSAGAGGDTSNFLTVAKLNTAGYTGPGGTLSSTGNIGVSQLTALLTGTSGNDAQLATAVTATTSGSFKINGVTINYNTSTDALKDVIARINASSAGVTSSYDTVNDKLVLSAKDTGSTAIALQDVSGNFLAATGLLATNSQTLGQNAQFSINGGTTQSGTSNTVANVIAGVTFQLLATGQSTVTVGQDVDKAVKAVKDFIDQFNSAIDLIDSDSSINVQRPTVLQGDLTLARIKDTLYRLLSSPADGLTDAPSTLTAIGISTGAVGSASGTTKHLVLDETKFRSIFQSNPDRVATILNASSSGVSQGVMAKVNDYLLSINSPTGVFQTNSEALSRQMKDIDAAIARMQQHLDQERDRLVRQFTALENSVAQIQSQQSALLAQLVRLT